MSAGRFPQRIKRGSSVVTIYKTPTNGYDAFTVVHYDASGARCRRMFTSYAQAHRATATGSSTASFRWMDWQRPLLKRSATPAPLS